MKTEDFASFGAVHLNITNLQKTIKFWTNVVGLKLRLENENSAELGTETKTLVVVHQSASRPFVEGYSGLYHVAIHAPNKKEFAKMVQRLINNNYRFSPTDHTMSKAIYLNDPDGITIEFTLETPERYKGMVIKNGYWVEDVDGTLRSPSDVLDLGLVLSELDSQNIGNIIHQDTYIGHFHFYASNLDSTNEFYKKIGFTQFNYGPQIMFADLGMEGPFKHRIALNTWHGKNKPLAPKENAGLNYYTLIFQSKEKLENVITKFPNAKKEADCYWLNDPTGNLISLQSV
jgi:catechol 2,3-dioxygenase